VDKLDAEKTQFVLDELLHPERGSYHNAFDFVFILFPHGNVTAHT